MEAEAARTYERRRAERLRMIRRGLLVAGLVVVIGAIAWVVLAVGIEALLEKILNLPSWLVVTLVFLLPALEASAFVGVIFPGEIAVLLGGVSAANGHTSLAAVLVAACLGAAIGDQIGYVVGRRWGQELLRRLPDRLLDEDRLQRGRAYIRRTGAKGVVLGRWTAALRALVPGLAGMAHMHYARFALANVAGGTLWALAVGLAGYAAGDRWKSVQGSVGSASYALLGLLIAAAVGWHLLRRRRERRPAGTSVLPGVAGPGGGAVPSSDENTGAGMPRAGSDERAQSEPAAVAGPLPAVPPA